KESRNEILVKILSGEYWLLRRHERSTVWQVYRQIVRSDGTKLRDYYLCTGCKRLMTSTDTSSLRSHTCHVKYLQQRASARAQDLEQKVCPSQLPVRKHSGHHIHWSYRATKTLLELWENNIEHLQSGPTSQAQILREIAKEMYHLGLKPSDIKIKMDNLRDRYSREAERQKVSGRPSKWPHFHELQKLLNALEETTPSSNSVKEENRSPDMETDGSIAEDEVQDVIEALPSLETYEEELDQQHSPPKHMYEAERGKAKRFMAIREERLALKKENFKNFQSFMKEIMTYNKNLCQVLCDDE
ncbi:hypothetical protein KR200_010709, partial [Drosophila serrata]